MFDFSDIAYLEANGSYTRVVMASKKENSLMVTLNLKALRSYLDDSFLKIHRSYVINPDYVSRICGNRVEMCTGEFLDVSRPCKKLVWDTLNVVTLGKRYKEKRAFIWKMYWLMNTELTKSGVLSRFFNEKSLSEEK